MSSPAQQPVDGDVVSSLPASSSSSAPRRYRPVANSIDLSDESRDTVALGDSEAWYPQFASQPLTVNKIQTEKQTGLNALLANRMTKSTFETRFLGGADLATLNIEHSNSLLAKEAAKEATAESLFNRSAKLGALLANRPDKQRLESLNVLKAPQGAASGAFAGLQAKLDASKKRDRLNSFLSLRPAQESLVKRGLLLDSAQASEPRERLASAKNALGDFFASRPNPEQLVKQKIITDIGDLPGGLERKQENQLVPAVVAALAGVKIVAVSLGFSHTVALSDAGVVYVFGSGANGRLGVSEGSFADVLQPVALPASHFGGEAVSAIDAGENHTAAITVSGRLYTWGTGAWGRLGLGNQDDQSVPRPVTLPAGETAAAVSCGAYHSLVVTSSRKLFAFGWNKNGRCGLGRKHPSLIVLEPVEVAFFSDPQRAVAAAEAGQGYSYATTAAGETFTWGTGSFGALGFGEEQDEWEPRALSVPALTQVALGATHTLAATKEALFSFGCNDKGQLGRTEEKDADSSTTVKSLFVPGQVRVGGAPVTNIRSLAAGKSHSLFVDATGVFAWGLGSRGILGLGDESDAAVPTRVSALAAEQVRQVDGSWTHSAAVTEDGRLFTWGAKNNGRLGY